MGYNGFDAGEMRDSAKLRRLFFRRGIMDPVLLTAIVFWGARTFHYWEAWVLFAVNLAGCFACAVYMVRHDPRLLERRSIRIEPLSLQRILVIFWRIIIAVSLYLSGRDFHVGWTRAIFGTVPIWTECISFVLFAAGLALFLEVLKANSFAASIVRVDEAQTVSSHGPYRFVRHPMYVSFILTGTFGPLALGSVVGMLISALAFPLIAVRLVSEERLLRRDLPGYAEYCTRTTSRLIPFLW